MSRHLSPTSLCQPSRYETVITSPPCALEPSPFAFAQRTHRSIWDCAQAAAALDKQQRGPPLQFSGLPVPFVRWYQLEYFRGRCQKSQREHYGFVCLWGWVSAPFRDCAPNSGLTQARQCSYLYLESLNSSCGDYIIPLFHPFSFLLSCF